MSKTTFIRYLYLNILAYVCMNVSVVILNFLPLLLLLLLSLFFFFFCYLALFSEYSNFPNYKCFLYWSTLVCCCEAPIILIAVICSFVRSLTREMGTDRLINCCEINSWCPNEWTHLIVLNVRRKKKTTKRATHTHTHNVINNPILPKSFCHSLLDESKNSH